MRFNSLLVVMMICAMGWFSPVTSSSSCQFTDTRTSRTIDLSMLSGRVMTTSVLHYLYSLYPCGSIPSTFCSNPDYPSRMATPFFCQFDYSLTYNNTLAYQTETNTTTTGITITANSVNVVDQTGHMCNGAPRIANLMYICSCDNINATLSVYEQPTCTYNAVVRAANICQAFGVTCEASATPTPTTTPTTTPTPRPTTKPPTPQPPTPRPTTPTPSIPAPTTAPTRAPPTPRPTSCTSDSDCSTSSYCYYDSTCHPSIPYGGTCSRTSSSRKQCANGACDYSSLTCQPLVPNGGSCDKQTHFPCVQGNYCYYNNMTHAATCQQTQPNGATCTSSEACDSGYCNNAGKCDTNPFAQLFAAAALGVVAIVLIVIGSLIVLAVSICCCVYRVCKRPQPVVVREPVHIQAYHAPYRQLQDGYTRV